MDLSTLLQNAWAWIGESPFANALSVLSFIWGCSAQFRLSRDKRARATLRAALNESESDAEALKKENKELALALECAIDQRNFIDPRNWLQAADDAERDASNDDAHSTLQGRLALTSHALASLFAKLAEQHAEYFPDKGRGNLTESIRFASIWAMLEPHNVKARHFLDEVEAIRHIDSLNRGIYVSEEGLRSAEHDGELQLDLAVGYVNALIEAGLHHYWDLHDDVMFEALSRRARRVARNRLGDAHKLTLEARRFWAESMQGIGQLEAADDEFEEILPLVKRIHGLNAQIVVDILFAQAGGQMQMGNVDRASSLLMRAERVSKRIPQVATPAEQVARNKIKARYIIDDLIAKRQANPQDTPKE